MKSSLVISVALGTLMSFSALGQNTRTTRQARPANRPATTKPTVKPAPKKPVVAKPSAQTTTQTVANQAPVEKSSFDRFYDRLAISYFGVFTSPTLEDWDSANAAISPAWGDTGRVCDRNCDTYAANLWSQIAFNYDFGAKMKFVVAPRWTTYFGHPRDMDRSAGEDRSIVGLEDFLIAFAGTIYTSEDKKFSWFIRPGMRLPTSHFSRHYDHPSFGEISHQLELAHFITYEFSKKLTLGLALQQRMWVFEYRYNASRLRLVTSPYVTYTVDDKLSFSVYYQNMIENNKRWESVNGKKPVFKDYYQDVLLGVGYNITPKINVMPYLGLLVDDPVFSTRSAYIGSWISWKIK